VTGIDLVFAGEMPHGIFAGSYYPTAPGHIRWSAQPELDASMVSAAFSGLTGRLRVSSFAEANGRLYAAVGQQLFTNCYSPPACSQSYGLLRVSLYRAPCGFSINHPPSFAWRHCSPKMAATCAKPPGGDMPSSSQDVPFIVEQVAKCVRLSKQCSDPEIAERLAD
jgi:hypothetical protein